MFGFLFNKKVLTRLTRFMICSFLMIYCMAFTVYAGDPDTRVKTYLNLSVEDDIYADENGTVFFTVFADIYGETGYLTGDVIISFDGCNYTVPIINESAVFMINDIVEPGDYYIKAWFGGDENYQNSTDSKMITIHPLKQPTSMRLDVEKEIITDENGKAEFYVTTNGLPENATGVVTCNIAGFEYKGEIRDGVANISVSGKFEPGNYTVDAEYKGDDAYLGCSNSTMISVRRRNQTVSPSNVDVIPSDNGKVTPLDGMVTDHFTAEAKYKGEILKASVSACHLKELTYKGKKMDARDDLKMKLDLSPLIKAVGGDGALAGKADEIISVSYAQKNNVNANTESSKKATIYPKLKLSKAGKSLLSKEQKSKLGKLIKAFNKAAKKNKIEYTIKPRSLKECKVEVFAKKTKDGKLGVKNGKVKGIKKVLVTLPGDTKVKKLGKKMYDIEVVDADKGIVKISGKKNFWESAELSVTR